MEMASLNWTFKDLARSVAIGMLAGLIAGLIAGGLDSRIAMRVIPMAAGPSIQGAITEAKATVDEITLGGTFWCFFGEPTFGISGVFYTLR